MHSFFIGSGQLLKHLDFVEDTAYKLSQLCHQTKTKFSYYNPVSFLNVGIVCGLEKINNKLLHRHSCKRLLDKQYKDVCIKGWLDLK